MTSMHCWVSLFLAIIFGVLGTLSMKLSDCFSRFKPTVSMALFYGISFIMMTFALKRIDISIVYAIWSGVGTILVMFLSVLFFNEKISIKKALFLLLIILGVVGINLGGSLYQL